MYSANVPNIFFIFYSFGLAHDRTGPSGICQMPMASPLPCLCFI